MNIIYRISDSGYNKIKPKYINNKFCLYNALMQFPPNRCKWHIIADNVCDKTYNMIVDAIKNEQIISAVDIGNGAGTFNVALDFALKNVNDDNQIIYFLQNDYLHAPNSLMIMQQGFSLCPTFVSLYDHPDKYISPKQGGNQYCDNGAEDTRVYLTKSCH